MIGSFDGCSGSKKSIFCKTECQRQWAKGCQINSYFSTGRHNLRSFLAVNSTQNYFLVARMLSFFVTFTTKVPYLTFFKRDTTKCDNFWQEMDREGGNKGKTRLTYNCAHLRSTKESLTDSVKKNFCAKIFLCENCFGWKFVGWTFFEWKFFWVKSFW